MKTAIVTDNTSTFIESEVKSEGIFIIEMPIIINGENFIQGKNLTDVQFYDALNRGDDVSTSQPSPGTLIDKWEEILDSGYDSIVYIPMSSSLSNSYNTANMMSEDYEGKVVVIDNRRISGTLRQSVKDAKYLADNGVEAAQIKKILEEESLNQSIYIAVDTLDYLKKGGRVTAAGAALASVLSIKPILSIQGGKLDAFAKVRGMAKCGAKLTEAIRNDINERFKDVSPEDGYIFTAGTLMSEEEINNWISKVEEAFPEYGKIDYFPLSLNVAAHIGPGSLAVGYCSKVKM